MRTNCCFTVAGPSRTLDVQAQSEWLRDEWVSVLKLMVHFRKHPSLATHAERMAMLEAVDKRALIREKVLLKKRKGYKRGGFLESFRRGAGSRPS